MYAKTFVGLVIGQVEKVISLQIDTELDSLAARYMAVQQLPANNEATTGASILLLCNSKIKHSHTIYSLIFKILIYFDDNRQTYICT